MEHRNPIAAAALFLSLFLVSGGTLTAVPAGGEKEPPPGKDGRGETITASELSEIFKALGSDNADERWQAVSAVLDLDKDSIPALKKRLFRDHKAGGESMKRIVYSLRKDLKDEKIKALQDKGKVPKVDDTDLEPPPEFLKILVERKRDDNIVAWRSATEIMTILVALTSMQTRESLLVVLDFSSANEYAFRKEIYQLMLWTGEKALPAMILREKSKDEHVQVVVNAYLGKMNMSRPGQQVQVKDPSVLAEILRLFGETKNFEALDSIIPFLNAENPLIRKAARDSILQFGKSSLWALRKAYKNYTETDPDPEWPAEKIAETLFAAQDSDRMAPLVKKLEEGLALAGEKKYDEMEKRFREILALQPMFERKSEMVKGYMDAARHYIKHHGYDRASFLLRVARRINSDPEKDDKIHAMIYYTDAMRDLEDGVADPDLMRKAVKLDPEFEEAGDKLEEIEKIYRGRKIKGYKILAAGGIGTTALLILLLILLKKW
jgi:hypothetical protein